MNEFGTPPIASNIIWDTQKKFQAAPFLLGAAWIACFSTRKILRSRFSDLLSLIFGYRYGWKILKKSQVLSSIGSTNCVNFKNFHWNHHKLKNNNEIAKSWNFKWPKNPFLTWYEKSIHEGLFYGSPTNRIDGVRSKDRTWGRKINKQKRRKRLLYNKGDTDSSIISNYWNFNKAQVT